jgi:hypothetical protein
MVGKNKRYFNQNEVNILLTLFGEAIETRDKNKNWVRSIDKTTGTKGLTRREAVKVYTKVRVLDSLL